MSENIINYLEMINQKMIKTIEIEKFIIANLQDLNKELKEINDKLDEVEKRSNE